LGLDAKGITEAGKILDLKRLPRTLEIEGFSGLGYFFGIES